MDIRALNLLPEGGGIAQEKPMSPAAETPRYPKLTPEQKASVLAELWQEFQLDNLRPKGGDTPA